MLIDNNVIIYMTIHVDHIKSFRKCYTDSIRAWCKQLEPNPIRKHLGVFNFHNWCHLSFELLWCKVLRISWTVLFGAKCIITCPCWSSRSPNSFTGWKCLECWCSTICRSPPAFAEVLPTWGKFTFRRICCNLNNNGSSYISGVQIGNEAADTERLSTVANM